MQKLKSGKNIFSAGTDFNEINFYNAKVYFQSSDLSIVSVNLDYDSKLYFNSYFQWNLYHN